MSNLNATLDKLWMQNEPNAMDTLDQKYVIISDVHLGNKSRADDFRHNEQITLNALTYYQKNEYTLILLGDFEELWQFEMPDILECYDDTIYKVIRLFGNNRVIRIYGNHDIDWSVYTDPTSSDPLNGRRPMEALVLKDTNNQSNIILLHGHQATLDADKFSWISRPITNLYGKTLEHIIDLDPSPELTKSMILKDYERERYDWAKDNKRLIICGHTHRAIFASRSLIDQLKEKLKTRQAEIQKPETSRERKEELIDEIYELGRKIQYEELKGRDIDPLEVKPIPCYFNTGCGLYKSGITVIEIENDQISLQKWDASKNNAPAKEFGKESISNLVNLIEN